MGWALAERKRARVFQTVRILREKQREKIARLAAELGYSYHYFKYSVLPELLARVECIEYDKNHDELVWVCDGESDTVEQARPVQG